MSEYRYDQLNKVKSLRKDYPIKLKIETFGNKTDWIYINDKELAMIAVILTHENITITSHHVFISPKP